MTVARGGKSQAAFRTISEVADELEVAQHVLRFWESKFPQVRPLKRGGGRRYYRPEDIELLREIRTPALRRGLHHQGCAEAAAPAPGEAGAGRATADCRASAVRSAAATAAGCTIDDRSGPPRRRPSRPRRHGDCRCPPRLPSRLATPTSRAERLEPPRAVRQLRSTLALRRDLGALLLRRSTAERLVPGCVMPATSPHRHAKPPLPRRDQPAR